MDRQVNLTLGRCTRFQNFSAVSFDERCARRELSIIQRITRTYVQQTRGIENASSSSALLLSAALSFFISYCYIRERLDGKTDNSRECMSITKVAKLDFQVVAFGHLSPIDTTQRRHHVSRWLMYLTRLKIPRAFSFFFEPPLSPCCPFLFFFILIRSTLLPLITYISFRS